MTEDIINKTNRHKCSECGMTESQIREEGYEFKVEQCRHCKQWFCEACLIEGDGCPYCSDIVPL
jgi:adenine-specific DNA methylase